MDEEGICLPTKTERPNLRNKWHVTDVKTNPPPNIRTRKYSFDSGGGGGAVFEKYFRAPPADKKKTDLSTNERLVAVTQTPNTRYALYNAAHTLRRTHVGGYYIY